MSARPGNWCECPECGSDARLQRDGVWRCDDNGFLGCDWSEDHDGEGVYWDAAGQRTETR